MVDERRSREIDLFIKRAATLAAVHSYWAVYGHEVGSNPPPLMAALAEFWLDRFGEGYPLPRGFSPEEDNQAPATREAEPAPRRTSKALEEGGWFDDSERRELERWKCVQREESVQDGQDGSGA